MRVALVLSECECLLRPFSHLFIHLVAQTTLVQNHPCTKPPLQSIVRLRQQHFFIGGENYNPWVQQFLSTDGEAPTPVGTTPREKTVLGKTKMLVKRMGTLIMPREVCDAWTC